MKRAGTVRGVVTAVLLAGVLALASACTDTRGRVYVRIGPPAPIVEVRPIYPGPGYVWIDGYQRWDGRAFIWMRGHWELPPRPRARWAPGHWERDRHGWYFIEGHWR